MELRRVFGRNAADKPTLPLHAQEQVEMSGVWPAGQVPSKKPTISLTPSRTKGVLHTFSKRDDRRVGAAEEAWVDARKLCVDDAHKLLVSRRFGAVRR